MLEQDGTAHIRAAIEEELGALRQFAALPATEIEDIARRLTRALAPYLADAKAAEPDQMSAA